MRAQKQPDAAPAARRPLSPPRPTAASPASWRPFPTPGISAPPPHLQHLGERRCGSAARPRKGATPVTAAAPCAPRGVPGRTGQHGGDGNHDGAGQGGGAGGVGGGGAAGGTMCTSSGTSSSGSAPSSAMPTAAAASATTSSSPSGCARPATSPSRPRTRSTTSSIAWAGGGGRPPWVPGVPSVVGGGGPAGAPARSRSATTSRGVIARSGIGSMRSPRTAPSTTSSTRPRRPRPPPPPPPPSPPGMIWRSTRLGWTSTARAAPGRLHPRAHARGHRRREQHWQDDTRVEGVPEPRAWAGASRDDEMQEHTSCATASSNNYRSGVALGQAAARRGARVGSTKRRREAEGRAVGGAMWPEKTEKEPTSWRSEATTPMMRCCGLERCSYPSGQWWLGHRTWLATSTTSLAYGGGVV